MLTRGPGRSVGGGAGSLACGPGERRGVTGDAGDAGDADVRAQLAGGCSARGKGELLGCCVTWTGGAGRGAAGQVARARAEERRKLGLAGKSWAAEGSAGPSQGKGRGVRAWVWGLAGFWVLLFFFYF